METTINGKYVDICVLPIKKCGKTIGKYDIV